MKPSLEKLLLSYGILLSSVDDWFARCRASSGKDIACVQGCSACCRGLFDITLLDAFYLKEGFDLLPAGVKKPALLQAEKRLKELRSIWKDYAPPYILNYRPEEEWDALMPDDDQTPCPLLGNNGVCLVYENRPMTCRLHGIPLVDVSGEIFHDEWCTLNFPVEDPLVKKDLHWGFKEYFQDELTIFQVFTEILLDRKIRELDTFIATALLVDYRSFDWKAWWMENGERITAAGSRGNR